MTTVADLQKELQACKIAIKEIELSLLVLENAEARQVAENKLAGLRARAQTCELQIWRVQRDEGKGARNAR
jgi:hypothetical protein